MPSVYVGGLEAALVPFVTTYVMLRTGLAVKRAYRVLSPVDSEDMDVTCDPSVSASNQPTNVYPGIDAGANDETPRPATYVAGLAPFIAPSGSTYSMS